MTVSKTVDAFPFFFSLVDKISFYLPSQYIALKYIYNVEELDITN